MSAYNGKHLAYFYYLPTFKMMQSSVYTFYYTPFFHKKNTYLSIHQDVIEPFNIFEEQNTVSSFVFYVSIISFIFTFKSFTSCAHVKLLKGIRFIDCEEDYIEIILIFLCSLLHKTKFSWYT